MTLLRARSYPTPKAQAYAQKRWVATPWVIGGSLLGLLLTLIFFAPAAWLAYGADHASDGKITLHAARGTVWAGSAEVVLSGGAGSAGAMRLPSRVYWAIAPIWLGIAIDAHAPCCTEQKIIRLEAKTDETWRLDAPSLTLPAEWLAGLGAPWNTLQLTGQLRLSAQALRGTLSMQTLAGHAQLTATNIGTALSTVHPLGSYRINMDESTLSVSTLEGSALELTGKGQLRQGKLQFRGEALAAIGREAALTNLLSVLGQRESSNNGRMRAALSF